MPLYPTLAVCAGVAVAALWDRGGGETDPGTAPAAPDADEDLHRPADQPSPATA
jgi:hypothetical protein